MEEMKKGDFQNASATIFIDYFTFCSRHKSGRLLWKVKRYKIRKNLLLLFHTLGWMTQFLFLGHPVTHYICKYFCILFTRISEIQHSTVRNWECYASFPIHEQRINFSELAGTNVKYLSVSVMISISITIYFRCIKHGAKGAHTSG